MLEKTLKENRNQILFVLGVLVIGTAALYVQGYFDLWKRTDPLMYGDSKLKLVFGGNHPALVSYTPEKRLSGHYTSNGVSVPSEGLVVLGFDEAALIARERNISPEEVKPSLLLSDYTGPGNTIRVAGVLRKMNSSSDKISFVSKKDFDDIQGRSIELKRTPDMMPKLFYYVSASDDFIQGIPFAEGSWENFKRDDKYFPLILGRAEANMMIKEKLISGTGSKIEDLFGKPVFVAGIFNSTGTALDVLHYLPEE